MKVEVLKSDGAELVFVLEEATPPMANTLRRAILQEVPVMAVDEVEFTQNDSAMYDEIIAHRLSMVPLTVSYTHLTLPTKA